MFILLRGFVILLKDSDHIIIFGKDLMIQKPHYLFIVR